MILELNMKKDVSLPVKEIQQADSIIILFKKPYSVIDYLCLSLQLAKIVPVKIVLVSLRIIIQHPVPFLPTGFFLHKRNS